MTRPAVAFEALGFRPLMQARGANSAGVEGIPGVPAGAAPAVFFSGRPTTKGTSNARAGWIEVLVVLDVLSGRNGRRIHEAIIALRAG